MYKEDGMSNAYTVNSSLGSPAQKGGEVGDILESMVSPLSVKDFLSRYWTKKPYVSHGDVNRFPSCLTSKELSNYHELARAYSGACYIANRGKLSNAMLTSHMNPANLLRMGMTVFMPDIASMVPDGKELLVALSRALGINLDYARLGGFASPPGNGLGMHYDVYDIFSIQLIGTKTFSISTMKEISYPYGDRFSKGHTAADELYPQAVSGFPDEDGVEMQSIEMKPGSVLYMPPGTWHSTEASDEESFSVSIGIQLPCMVDTVLKALKSYLVQDARWRRPLYGTNGDDAQRTQVSEQITGLLHELLGKKTSITSDYVILSSLAEGQFGKFHNDSRFQRVPTASLEIIDQGEQMVSIDIYNIDSHQEEDRRLTLSTQKISRSFADIFRWIDDRDTPFTIHELNSAFPDRPEQQLDRVVNAAQQGKFVKALWFPPKNIK